MKKIIVLSLIFTILGMGILLGTGYFCLISLNNPAIMVQTPTAALECSENLMAAIKAGDYDAASGYLCGQVDLGTGDAPKEDVAKLLWEAFEASITYEFLGDCYATTTGVARDVRITTLNPASVNENLTQRVENLAESEDADVYDDEGNVQEDRLDQLLLVALEESLKQDATTITQEIQLNLVYQNGQWWVVPDGALLQAISGGVAG